MIIDEVFINHNKTPRLSKIPDIRDFFFTKIQIQIDEKDKNWWKKISGFQELNIIESQYINKNILPIAPPVRDYLRYQWKYLNNGRNETDRYVFTRKNFIFGTTRGQAIASKIKVTHAYKINNNTWEFRIWGWIPCKTPFSDFKRDQFLFALKEIIQPSSNLYTSIINDIKLKVRLTDWYQFDYGEQDGALFLNKLLKLSNKGDHS